MTTKSTEEPVTPDAPTEKVDAPHPDNSWLEELSRALEDELCH